MMNLSNLSNLKKIPEKIFLNRPSFVFILSLVVFVLDNVLNMFGHYPVFTSFSILIMPLLWLQLWAIGKLSRFMIYFTCIFIISFLISGFFFGFNLRSFSDLIFILLFITSYFYYRGNIVGVLPRRAFIFPVMVFLLFAFAFTGINSQSFNRLKKESQTQTYKSPKKVKHDQDALDVLEYNRNYKNGLFRIPHVAAYFLGFISLFYAFLFTKKRKWLYLFFSIIFIFLMFYSGVRTFAAAIFFAVIIYFIRKKNLWFFSAFTLVFVLMFVFRYNLFSITRNTLLEPFSSLLITISDNIDRLSRVLIWKSWLLEMQKFHWYNFIAGKSFYQSVVANGINLHNPL
ncbi:MAG: hypothetical protein K9H16_07810 [Bacteroidales bacterium]|nr:hypothetical protein [Bacteroidales bacterium]